MGNNSFGKNMIQLEKVVRDQVEQAFLDGVKAGSVHTAATLYKTFKVAGLETDNMLFTILIDIAKNNGCDDLPAYIEKVHNSLSNKSVN